MYSFASLLSITRERELFEKISAAKKLFVTIFSEVGNRVGSVDLTEIHAGQKGIKISKGNELQHCPYQVLDIIRDFDPESGLNIRVLHWWGRGLFLQLYLGRIHPFLRTSQVEKLTQYEFNLCKADRWNYQQIIDQDKMEPFEVQYLPEHLLHYSHLQLIKTLPITEPDQVIQDVSLEIKRLYSLLRK
ncbi:hypothetical protein [Cyclobacterium xiamenense]|uniref:hypothetical protein n=1 Tax=Cyclobacterium xiamenense TaxID=1297121 RepID=UPI0012B736F2|nr:hypothetical protein [Cyclobacterium xiamenense]